MTKFGIGACALSLFVLSMITTPLQAQSERGNAELKAPGGKIVVDYGRPELKGRDPLTWQKEGDYWRMGMNSMTTLTTPVELVFGKSKLDKGKYGIWLLKKSADNYELVFNSDTSGMGMNHDTAKDVISVPMKKAAAPGTVETFTIDLKSGSQGGSFVMTWGTVQLSSDFRFGK